MVGLNLNNGDLFRLTKSTQEYLIEEYLIEFGDFASKDLVDYIIKEIEIVLKNKKD